jgi:hypothetical protein
MKKMFCQECGAEILIEYCTPSKTWRMKENGEFERDDPQPRFGDNPEFNFFCSEDREHILAYSHDRDRVNALDKWQDDVEFLIRDRNLHLE